MVKIKGVIDASFVDWPAARDRGRLCATVFLGGCNFRCPFCHNRELVLNSDDMPSMSEELVISRLEGLRPWIEAVCITGGEPTVNKGLMRFLRRLKASDFKIKLDTNGYIPEILNQILEEGLVDHVAMDVKTILYKGPYSECTGVSVDIGRIKESIRLLKEAAIPHEFRMTILPRFHSDDIVSEWINELNGSGSFLRLQRFLPRNTLDPAFQKEPPFTEEEFNRLFHFLSIQAPLSSDL
ncbi:MAG: anaerobic ribonucleoside-triphosphate reductase activating protein [Dissulfurimicrobium sp.]|uniref:anaerobic ribonucleoside-triphosphate reductase activating protein n=1 Tax=Dissulfurimicrobium sp. TaxID=2022436 RepID=UPI00404B6CDA